MKHFWIVTILSGAVSAIKFLFDWSTFPALILVIILYGLYGYFFMN